MIKGVETALLLGTDGGLPFLVVLLINVIMHLLSKHFISKDLPVKHRIESKFFHGFMTVGCRIFEKLLADFTGTISLAHPFFLGSRAFWINMVWQVSRPTQHS